MASKITYDNKSNLNPIIDRSKQSTAEDWNEVKAKFNLLLDELGTGSVSDNFLIYSVNSVGDLADLVDSITDSGLSKIYKIQVKPGDYTTKPVDLSSKPNIYINGVDKAACIFRANSANDSVFILGNSTGISDLTIEGATSGTAIRYEPSIPGFAFANNITITNCSTGVYFDGNVNAAMELDTTSFSGTIGIAFDHNSGNLTLRQSVVTGTSTIGAFIDSSGSNSILTLDRPLSFSPNLTTFIKVSDGASLSGNSVGVVECFDGIVVSGTNTTVRITAMNIFNPQNDGFRIEGSATGITLGLFATTITGAGRFNVNVLNPNSTVFGNGFSETEKFSIVSGARFYAYLLDTFEGDESLKVLGEIHGGTPDRPSESCFGSGDSYAGVGKILVYTDDGLGSQVDITEAASSVSGSTFTLPNGNINTCFYIASNILYDGDYLKTPGIKYITESPIDGVSDITVVDSGGSSVGGSYNKYDRFNGEDAYRRTDNNQYIFFLQGWWCIDNQPPGTNPNYNETQYISQNINGSYFPVSPNLGSPSVTINTNTSSPFVVEYWDGVSSQWESVSRMARSGNAPHNSFGNTLFENRGAYQLWLNLLLSHDLPWEKNDPVGLGSDRYWIRIRLTSAITTPPVLQQIKVHSDRTEINKTGFMEFFGTARFFRTLPWDAGLLQAANNSPGNQDLFLSDNVNRGYIENEFADGATDRVGFNTTLPPETDTSSPIRLRWIVKTDNGSLGTVNWNVRWAHSKDGNPIYNSTADAPGSYINQKEINILTPAPANDTQITYFVDMDISDMIPIQPDGSIDVLWVTIERQGGSDSHSGNVSLVNVQPLYASVALGGHI